jgi:hypothetical protein
MQTSPSQALTTQQKVKPNKLVIGFLAAVVTAIIASTGVAGAQAQNGSGYGGNTVNIDLTVNGNNNTIIVIINYFFGG